MSIEQAYNRWAIQYDTNKNKTRDLDRQATIQSLKKYSFQKVIELGCGTGKNTVWLLSKAEQIIGLDFSQEMLNQAALKINDNRVDFRKVNLLQNWGIQDQYSDLITCSLTLEHIQDLNIIFAQAYKKSKKNGLFFICELHPFKQYTGSKARFKTAGKIEELTVYNHHFSEYITVAMQHGFTLLETQEWYDEDSLFEIPRLISFIFKKAF